MEKLLRLEQELLKAKEYLAKQMDSMMGSQMNPADAGVNTAMKSEDKKPLKGRQSELDQDKDGDIEADDLAALREKKKKMKKAEHPDEKEDKELIAEALDRHNEQKHGEAKDKDSAKKDMGLKKNSEQLVSLPNGQWLLEKAATKPANPEEGKRQQFIDDAINQARKPAVVTDASGKTSMVSPEQQVEAQKKSAADKKAKFEAEAAARRAKYRKEGSLK